MLLSMVLSFKVIIFKQKIYRLLKIIARLIEFLFLAIGAYYTALLLIGLYLTTNR
jgi:hypothetical protein